VDSKKLEQKLNEIAEWVYPSVSQDNSTERVISPTSKKNYKHSFTPKPDLGPRIISFKNCLRPCEWCGKILDQKQNITKQTIPKRGDAPEIVKWHMSCYNCHRIWDPVKGQLQAVSKTIERKRITKSQK
jgi:hypothetical protein